MQKLSAHEFIISKNVQLFSNSGLWGVVHFSSVCEFQKKKIAPQS